MNSSSKVIMAATMVMGVSLVMVLSLVLVLLAEIYCSLLLRCSRHRDNSLTLPITTVTATTTTTTSLNQTISATGNHSPSSLNVLNTGVLQNPKTFFQTKTESSLPISQDQILEIEASIVNGSNQEKPTTSSVDNFVYISNPIYLNEATTTPFETPQSSPSRLETGESSSSSSGEEDNDMTQDSTPTLSPMKNLPEKAFSVSLKDSKSLETSANESNSNGGSSSSSGSPYTSPSW